MKTKPFRSTHGTERKSGSSVKGNKAAIPRNILLPIDFSESTDKVLDYAVPLAGKFCAKIVLLHVVEPMIYPPEAGFVPVDETKVIQAAKRRLKQIGEGISPSNLSVKSLVRLGSPYHEISEAARELKADMIVISTHGYTGLKHVFMGSTAERVVRHAPCPVLVLK